MKLKKILYMVLGSVMIYGSVVSVSANVVMPVANEVAESSIGVEGFSGIVGIMPRDVYHINGDSYSGKGYTSTIYCKSAQGNTLNIYVRNDSKVAVNFMVWKEGTKLSTISVPAGTGYTRTFTNSSGVWETFKVEVSTDYGDNMSLYVNARQFNK